MKVYTTAPLEDPRDARTSFTHLEEIGYDGAFSFEAKHDPFLPLVLAAEAKNVPVVAAELGPLAAAVGSVCLAREQEQGG